MCMYCKSLFVALAIVLSVLRYADSDYPFGIFKLFLHTSKYRNDNRRRWTSMSSCLFKVQVSEKVEDIKEVIRSHSRRLDNIMGKRKMHKELSTKHYTEN